MSIPWDVKMQVLIALQKIPKGKVTTYKNLAFRFWLHPRAIASIMKYNKDPLTYPCYKVISASGKISGYNTEQGVPEKVEKLKADGIPIIDWKISAERII